MAVFAFLQESVWRARMERSTAVCQASQWCHCLAWPWPGQRDFMERQLAVSSDTPAVECRSGLLHTQLLFNPWFFWGCTVVQPFPGNLQAPFTQSWWCLLQILAFSSSLSVVAASYHFPISTDNMYWVKGESISWIFIAYVWPFGAAVGSWEVSRPHSRVAEWTVFREGSLVQGLNMECWLVSSKIKGLRAVLTCVSRRGPHYCVLMGHVAFADLSGPAGGLGSPA